MESQILDQLAKAPPPGFARWNGRLVAKALGDVSDDAAWLSCAGTTCIWIAARVGV
jgi:hypothetical protein